ncbi:MAG: hypothetical protein RIR11_3894, partial [Bacteroidota bacterium]
GNLGGGWIVTVERYANKPQNNLLQAFYNLLHLKSHGRLLELYL